MHFLSFPFHLFFIYIYIFLCTYPYTFHFITFARCLNNEHEDNQEIQLKFGFERLSCTNENVFEKDMDDETLPLEMRRLIDQENKQILPHQEVTEIINPRSNEEKKEVKISITLSTEIKKEIISPFEFIDIFAWFYQDMPGVKYQDCRAPFPFKPERKPIDRKSVV